MNGPMVEVPAGKLFVLIQYAQAWCGLERYETPMMSLLWVAIVCSTLVSALTIYYLICAKRDIRHYLAEISMLNNKLDHREGGDDLAQGPHLPLTRDVLSNLRRIFRLAVDPGYREDNPDMVTEYAVVISDNGKSFKALMPVHPKRWSKAEYDIRYCKGLIQQLMGRITFYNNPKAEWYERNILMPWEK